MSLSIEIFYYLFAMVLCQWSSPTSFSWGHFRVGVRVNIFKLSSERAYKPNDVGEITTNWAQRANKLTPLQNFRSSVLFLQDLSFHVRLLPLARTPLNMGADFTDLINMNEINLIKTFYSYIPYTVVHLTELLYCVLITNLLLGNSSDPCSCATNTQIDHDN